MVKAPYFQTKPQIISFQDLALLQVE